jgi:hypothetical protein
MRLRLLLAVFGAMVLGCDDDHSHELAPECEAIVDRCHDLDPGAGPIHECHEFAEAEGRSGAECLAMQASCFASCSTGADAGARDGGITDDAAVTPDAGEGAHADGGEHMH